MTAPRIGVYPGTFDPITNGHMDIVRRAVGLVDRLVVGVAANPGKAPMFSIAERRELVCAVLDAHGDGLRERIEVKPFDTLLMTFALENRARLIVRGLRAVSDFEYEFQMTGMNARLEPGVETVFLMASERQQFVSSRFVKEIARLGGDVREFVPTAVHDRLSQKLEEQACAEVRA